jgi:glycosyltransferase involved in cell wall biosynthesis
MKFVVITHVDHIEDNRKFFAYGPYVREMNVWGNHVNEIVIVSPLAKTNLSPIDLAYTNDKVNLIQVKPFSLTSVKAIFSTLIVLPSILRQIFKAMQQADHIHLRCPGNMGLLGALVQILFPKTPKTAKYAGNWDPKSKQPWSYRLQKWIISNPVLTKKMQVLVYGEWENSTRNVKPFFTASYKEVDKIPTQTRVLTAKIRFLFVGTLSSGKQPMYAVRLVEQLLKNGVDCVLDCYGEGIERSSIDKYLIGNQLEKSVFLHGNQSAATVQKAYQESHFLVLPSKSEGWPKVVAEAMFWGCLPISTAVSCVPYMLDYGKRGVVLTMHLESDVQQIFNLLQEPERYQNQVDQAFEWSRIYSLDYFESEIETILKSK